VNFNAAFSPSGITVGDFNGDRKLDLVVAGRNSTMSLLFGRGDGTFASPVDIALQISPASVTAGDFNGDGIPDLALTSLCGGATVLFGKGDGTFANPFAVSDTVCGGGGPFVSAHVADINGDGLADLVFPPLGMSVLQGRKDGKLQLVGGFGPDGIQFAAVGDFNGDGQPDVITSGNGRAWLMTNNTGK
jgi:FG-GAP-like repeat/FG-GAP repeat